MSYCRFSCSRWTSDVYAYANVLGEFVVHVAGLRIVGEVPAVPGIVELAEGRISTDDWLAAHRAEAEFLETAVRAPIDLPHAGESFYERSAEALIERLQALRALGFHVPEHAFARLLDDTVPDDTGVPAEGLP